MNKKNTKFIKITKLLKRREIFLILINFMCFSYSYIFEHTHLKLAFLMCNIYIYIYIYYKLYQKQCP